MKHKILIVFCGVILSFLLVFTILFNTIPRVSYKTKDDFAYVCGQTNKADIILKDTYKNKTVTSIYKAAFYKSKIKSISFNESLREIGIMAFKDSKNLSNIAFNSNLKYICNNSFSGCVGLKAIDLSMCSNLYEIGGFAFADCTSLRSVILPSGLKYISSYAFSNCISLTEIVIPYSVIEVSHNAFYNCNNLNIIYLNPNTIVE